MESLNFLQKERKIKRRLFYYTISGTSPPYKVYGSHAQSVVATISIPASQIRSHINMV